MIRRLTLACEDCGAGPGWACIDGCGSGHETLLDAYAHDEDRPVRCCVDPFCVCGQEAA